MTKATTAASDWYQAKQAFLWVDGARPPEWRKIIVRDRRTGKLAEVSLQGEEDPIDPGDEGVTYCVAKGEKLPADSPVVRAKPAQFMPCSPP